MTSMRSYVQFEWNSNPVPRQMPAQQQRLLVFFEDRTDLWFIQVEAVLS